MHASNCLSISFFGFHHFKFARSSVTLSSSAHMRWTPFVVACAVLAPAAALVSPPAGLPAPVVAPALALLARDPRRCSVALSTSSQFQGSSDGVGAHALPPRRPALRGRRAPLTVVLSPVGLSLRRSARLPLAPPMSLSSFFDSE